MLGNLKGFWQAMEYQEYHTALLTLLVKLLKHSEKEIVYIFVQDTDYKSDFNNILQGCIQDLLNFQQVLCIISYC